MKESNCLWHILKHSNREKFNSSFLIVIAQTISLGLAYSYKILMQSNYIKDEI